MSELGDLMLLDEMDPFAREVGPLEALRQDIVHWLQTAPGSVVFAPEYGFSLENYLSGQLPSGLATAMQAQLRDWDRVRDANVTLEPMDAHGEVYRLTVNVEAESGFLALALSANKDGKIEVL